MTGETLIGCLITAAMMFGAVALLDLQEDRRCRRCRERRENDESAGPRWRGEDGDEG